LALVRSNQIYTVTSAGTGLTALTSVGKNYRPRWSPTGTRIAYIHETAAGAKDIWVMSSAGANKQRVTHVGTVTAPTWSPNGTFIAFGSPLQKVRSTAPFGPPTTLRGSFDGPPFGPMEVEPGSTVAWSPNGHSIAYYSTQGNSSPDHYLNVFDTVTHGIESWNAVGGSCCGEGYFADLGWSPSGNRLIYSDGSYCPECQDGVPPPFVRIDNWPNYSDGGYPEVDFDKQPAFSPSGRFVAVMNPSSGTQKIFVSRANGSHRHLVTAGYQPDWQPLP
jgi:Tol biopolymer transport system component